MPIQPLQPRFLDLPQQLSLLMLQALLVDLPLTVGRNGIPFQPFMSRWNVLKCVVNVLWISCIFRCVQKDLLVKASRSYHFETKREHRHHQGLFIRHAMGHMLEASGTPSHHHWMSAEQKKASTTWRNDHLRNWDLPVDILRSWSISMSSISTHAHINFTGPRI